MDWEQLYCDKNTPWDREKPHPEIIDYFRKYSLQGRILVPGCGYGHDAGLLAQGQTEVVGIDLSAQAIARAKQKYGRPRFEVQNLFELTTRKYGSFDWAVEHNCFTAIDPKKRPLYVRALHRVLKPGGHLLAILYLNPDIPQGHRGPPNPVSPQEVDALFKEKFEILQEWTPQNTFAGREGRERVYILQKKKM